jgi:hypothetical protein
MSPVTATFPDRVVDAVTERRGTDQLLDEIADLLDHGFHYSPITYPNPDDSWADHPNRTLAAYHNARSRVVIDDNDPRDE